MMKKTENATTTTSHADTNGIQINVHNHIYPDKSSKWRRIGSVGCV